MDEKELEQKLDEIDKKVTPSYLRKRLKLALYKKVEAGDISAIDDLKKLEALEATPEAAATASPQLSSPDRPSGKRAPCLRIPKKKKTARPRSSNDSTSAPGPTP